MAIGLGSHFAAHADGHEIYYNIWKPTGEVKAKVIAIHGYGEHIHRYDHVFAKFAEAGILVKGMDNRGHGRTHLKNRKSRKGFVASATQVLDDMLQLNSLPVAGVPGEQSLPTFVFGHSLGAAFALNLVVLRKDSIPNFRGVIAQAPCFRSFAKPGKQISPLLIRVVDLVGGTFLGKLSIQTALELEVISSDATEQQRYKEDSLNHSTLSLRLGRLMLSRLPKAVLGSVDKFDAPILVHHSVCDQLTDSAVSRKFVESIASSDKTFFGYSEAENIQHESKYCVRLAFDSVRSNRCALVVHNEPKVADANTSAFVAWMLERSN
ncbi:hypothetical protein HDU98_004221 [Podochytrium sp. JEL0797]|nr:hypothetical protein HDU98_004221 [Podochytrium sp. JEL0797]